LGATRHAGGPTDGVRAARRNFSPRGTPRITHSTTTPEFPAGDLSFLRAISADRLEDKPVEQAEPAEPAVKAAGRYEGRWCFVSVRETRSRFSSAG